MLFQASGVSLLRLSIRVALGEPVVVDGPIVCARVGWRFMFQLPMSARRVVSIETGPEHAGARRRPPRACQDLAFRGPVW